MNFTRSAIALAACAVLCLPQSVSAAAVEGETWKPIGTGLFRENFLHVTWNLSSYPEVEVEIMESEQVPGRYRIMNPYANYPAELIGSPGCKEGEWYITVDASDPEHCYIETSRTGFYGGVAASGALAVLVAGSVADDYYNNLYGDWELAEIENRCGKLVDGAITFPPNALLTSYWPEDVEFDLGDISWAHTDEKGMFRLKLPGAPDLDIAGSLKGINDAKTELSFEITLGASVEKARVALVPGRNYEGNDHEGVISGETPSVEINASGTVTFPYTEDGFYTLVVVPYLDGTPRTPFFNTMEIAFNEDEWRKAGQALYRDGIFSGVEEMIPYGFVYPTYEYYVDVEESVEKPGYLRLVDPYGDCSPLSSGYTYDTTSKHYLYIDATDPDFVMIERMNDVGLNLGYGRMEIWSKTNRLMFGNDKDYYQLWVNAKWSEDDIYQMACDNAGLFYEDEITFPKNAIHVSFSDVHYGVWYSGNSKNEFRLKFQPGQIRGAQSTDVNTIAADIDAPAEYYRLDGTRADASALTPGLYIIRQGSKATKTLIR